MFEKIARCIDATACNYSDKAIWMHTCSWCLALLSLAIEYGKMWHTLKAEYKITDSTESSSKNVQTGLNLHYRLRMGKFCQFS